MLLLLRAARNFSHPRENHLGQCRIDSQQQRQPNKDNNTSSRWADSQHFKVTSPPTWKSQSLVLWSPPLGELLSQPFSQLHLHYSLIQALEEMELKLPTFWASTFTPRVHKLSNFLLPGFCLWVYLTKEMLTMCSLQSVMCPQMVTMFPTPRWTYDAQQGGDLKKRFCHGDTLEVQHFSYVSPCQCTIGTSSKTLVNAFISGTHKCFPYSTRAGGIWIWAPYSVLAQRRWLTLLWTRTTRKFGFKCGRSGGHSCQLH